MIIPTVTDDSWDMYDVLIVNLTETVLDSTTMEACVVDAILLADMVVWWYRQKRWNQFLPEVLERPHAPFHAIKTANEINGLSDESFDDLLLDLIAWPYHLNDPYEMSRHALMITDYTLIKYRGRGLKEVYVPEAKLKKFDK